MLRFAIIFCAAAMLWMPSFVHALAVSPATIDLSSSKGETVQQTISVINNDAADQKYFFGTISFVPDVTTGDPQFLSSDADQSELSKWIDFPVGEVVVPARTMVDVPFVVSVPMNAASGTYYAAVTVSIAPSEIVASNGASIEAKTAVLIFLTIEGENVEKMALLDFVSPDEGVTAFHALSYVYRLQNQGNVLVKPKASIIVQDFLGRTIFVADANPGSGRVLPGTTRTFAGELSDWPHGFVESVKSQVSLFAIGPVTATLQIEGIDSNGPAIHYWMFPWQMIVTMVGCAAIIWCVWHGIRVLRARISRISTGS